MVENEVKYKKCSKCGIEKEFSFDYFPWRDKNKGILRAECKVCRKEYSEGYQEKNKEKLAEQGKIYYQEHKEEFAEQGKIYREEHKEEIKARELVYRENNKEKISEKGKKYYEENKEWILAEEKEYRENNKEEVSKERREYREKNKDQINEYAREFYYKNREEILNKEKERRQTPEYKEKAKLNAKKSRSTPRGKIRHNISVRIRKAFKKIKQNKDGSISKYLPYTMDELLEHIEKQFLEPGNEWMNWDNQGVYYRDAWDDNDKSTWVWNLDHIIPESEFNYESMKDEEFQKCWALSNLRPLSAKQNILDGTSRARHSKKGIKQNAL
jgi:hypothetical protein